MTAATAPTTLSFSPPPTENPTLLNLLIVEAEYTLRDAYREAASDMGYRTSAAESIEQALRLTDSQTIDVVFLDLKPPMARALEVLGQMKTRHPEIEVIAVTSYGTVESAVQAMKSGAYDYVTKPFSLGELKLLLERVAAQLKLKSENRMRCENIRSKQGFGNIIGRAPEMDKIYRIIARAAYTTHPVLILDEWPVRPFLFRCRSHRSRQFSSSRTFPGQS